MVWDLLDVDVDRQGGVDAYHPEALSGVSRGPRTAEA